MTDILQRADAWFPTDYMDEGVPRDRAHPNDWIVDGGGECHFLAPGDEDEGLTRFLNDGDIVSFVAREDFGTATLRVNPDWSYTVSAPMPVGAEQCCALNGWQADTLSRNVRRIVDKLQNNIGIAPADLPEEWQIAYYSFTDPIAFMFRDGAFHLCAEVASS